MTDAATDIHDEMVRLNPGVRTTTAGYGTTTAGYVLMGLAARVDTDQELRDFEAVGQPLTIRDVVCANSESNGVSICVRTSPRGTVEVMSFFPTDLTQLAAVTEEAWRAQPFGCGC